LVLASAWPDDGLLVARQLSGSIVRTRDAGATWEHMPGAVVGADLTFPQLLLADGPNGTRVLFLLNGADVYTTPPCTPVCQKPGPLVYRSTDDGATWEAVLGRLDGLPEAVRTKLVVSHDFERDGLVFGLVGLDEGGVGHGVLVRSTDWGLTWSLLDPAPGRWLRDIELSPAFTEDRMVLLATGIASRPWWDPHYRDPLPQAPGLMLSTDNGDTWQPHSDELIDRSLSRLQLSPDFLHDGLLFAIGYGRLVESHDRGASWELVPALPNMSLASLLSLSPTFGQDRVALAAVHSSLGHGAVRCDLYRTTDGGITWTQVPINVSEADRYDGCSTPRLLESHGRLWALLQYGRTRYWSMNGGQRWDPLPLPNGQPLQQLIPVSNFPDMPRLIGTSLDGRVWIMPL
jgi:photosystem II stability/assembly factor-like uncharacterized protein